MHARFALYNYAGNPTGHYFVEKRTLDSDAGNTDENVSHHVIVVDRSGSMYREIDALKNMLVKLLTLEEYQNAGMLVSVVSYSSRGDVTSHFERIPVRDVMQEGSPYIEAIRKIRVTGLTCISQALDYAKGLIRDDETTCISLHSDGFANDYSPTAERQAIEQIAGNLQANNVFVNTIAYSAWSDFKLLSGIANALSGVCIRASNIKQVYDALHDTTTLLAGQVAPAYTSPLDGATYQIFVSNSARKINGGAEDLTIRGLGPDDDKAVYRYREVTEAEYTTSTLPICGEGAGLEPVLAFSRVNLAEGNLNTAKYGLVTTRDRTLLDAHAKALTNEEIADFSEALENALFDGVPADHVRSTNFGLDTSTTSVLDLVTILNEHSRDFTVDLSELRSHYTSRSVKRVAGTRDEEGNLIKPRLKTAYTDDAEQVKVQRFDINRNTATINMLLARPVNLVDENDNAIPEVAGVRLDNLSTFNNYTVVGDGSLNLDHMNVHISSKKLFRALQQAGVLDGDFDPTATYTIRFSDRPLVDYNQTFDPNTLDGVFTRLATAKVLESMAGAMVKDASDTYTAEQVQALKDHYLSTSLNINFPTTNPYIDLNEALSRGEIDTRLSYKVDLGSREIISLSKLHSANQCLQRFFTATGPDENDNIVEIKKPTMIDVLNPNVTFDYKKLSARTQITAVDDLMKPIFEDFLGFTDNGALEAALKTIGAEDLTDAVKTIRTVDADTAVETLTELRTRAGRYQDRVFRSEISPLVFYIGSAGLVPDEFGVKALSADDLTQKYPDLKLGKSEKEGTFFDLPNGTLITVYTKGEYFSTGESNAASVAAK